DAGVEPFLHDVAEGAVEDQLDADIGIVPEHRLQLRPDHAFQRMVGERQPDRARRPVAERHQRRDLVLDLGHAWRDRLEQPLARRRRRDVAGRARQQPDAHTGFKLLDRVAEGRLHDADPCRRPGEAAFLGNDPEPGQLVEIRLFHAALAARRSPTLIDGVDWSNEIEAGNRSGPDRLYPASTSYPHIREQAEMVSAVEDAGSKPAAWGAVLSMALCVAMLIASEFMPVSLLTPMAEGLSATEGQTGQAISISGLFAVAASLLITTVAGTLNRKWVLVGLTVFMLL